MPDVTQYAFSAGLIDPSLIMRQDLDKYGLALREARNWQIDELGAALTRPGTQFVDYIQDEGEPTRTFAYRYSELEFDNYLLIFSKNRIRFVQSGAYVLETAKAKTVAGDTITCAAHGYANGDWVKIAGDTFSVTNVTTNTFKISHPILGPVAAPPAGTVARIYTISSPYATADLARLNVTQDLTQLKITHPAYSPRLLDRIGHTNWLFSLWPINTDVATFSVSNLSVTASSAGTYAALFAATYVDADGNESLLDTDSLFLLTGAVEISVAGASYKITCDTKSAARRYRFYRSRVVLSTEAHWGMQLGFIGESYAPDFTDNNIAPDFSQSPLNPLDPFTPGAVTQIDVTAPGSGHDYTSVVSSLSGGSGLVFKPVIIGGAFRSIRLLGPGKLYTSTAMTVGAPGSGATLLATLQPVNYPSCSIRSQQRTVAAGLAAQPNRIIGSRLNTRYNFNFSDIPVDTDPYFLDLDADEATAIHNLASYPDGYFLFTTSGVFQVRGSDDAVITFASAKQSLIYADGVSNLPPLYAGSEILFMNSALSEVRLIQRGNTATQFGTTSISLLVNHLVHEKNPIISWAFAAAPVPTLLAVRQDGTMIFCTLNSEQSVFAWSRHDTRGIVKDVTAVREARRDTPYLTVQRYVQGAWRTYLERFVDREHTTVEEMWSVDCALNASMPKPAATLEITTTTATASTSVFLVSDEGKIIRAQGGKARITNVLSPVLAEIEILSAFVPASEDWEIVAPIPAGAWTMTRPFTTFTGLAHLEGQSVEILADGRVFPNLTVTNGSVTLPEEASAIVIGLGFTADLEFLPPVGDVQTRRKRIVNAFLRLEKSRGLEVGRSRDFYPIEEQQDFYDGLALDWNTGLSPISLSSAFSFDVDVQVRKTGPLAGKILGITMELDIGPA